ncbi:MAG: hypothetical protein RMJ67_06055 [Elusimicrobiota bacterium]|nr:hypothetical protein [Endomicrobiia bacterium]MDW8166056.1 hypothetical protein [Elusimicrobiota bacterium]
MSILINPRKKRRKRKRATAKRNPKRKSRKAFSGDVARPKLVFEGVKGGKRIYARTDKSKKLFADVIVKNPKRKRRNPSMVNTISNNLMTGLYGVAGIAGVNAITNIASKFLPLDNTYLKSAVKLLLSVSIPELLKNKLGREVSKTMQVVAVSYVLFELLSKLLPENVKTLVSAIEAPQVEKSYYALPYYNNTFDAIYPENSYVSNVQYELN